MQRRRGFTLIELSIVLVIIGLIIGGVLVGRDLIRAAELRAVQKDVVGIQAAVNTFRLKYNCLPGDCTNATTYFGLDPEGCTQAPGKTPKTATCNGDGDKLIDAVAGLLEEYTFWQQLSAASLFRGLYRGSHIAPNTNSDETVNPSLPAHRGFGWLTSSAAFDGYELNTSTPYIGNGLVFWPRDYTSTSGMFTPAEALSYDTKYDDGKAATGQIQALGGGILTDCTTTQNASAAYDTVKTGKSCNLIYQNAY